MNILYLAHRIPYPPNKGDKLRSYRQLARLAERNNVWCACFVDTTDDLVHVERLRSMCVDVLAVRLRPIRALTRGALGALRGTTITESYFCNAPMRRGLSEWGRTVRFDAVVAFSSSMAPYALSVPAGRRVLDLCDVDSCKWYDYAERSHGPMKWVYHLEGSRLARRECQWSSIFDATLVISDAEAQRLPIGFDRSRLHVVGNGVDVPQRDQTPEENGVPTVGFVGVMDYKPNMDGVEWFVRNCWPSIRQAVPDARFRIVGRSPTRRVRRLAGVPGVTVVGEVNDVQDELRTFAVSVAPLRIARGLQNKVLEAMAAARPVVLTSPAAEGIAAEAGAEYVVAQNADEFSGAVIRLLRNDAERRRIGQLGCKFVRLHHRWDLILESFELVVTAAAAPMSSTVDRAHDLGVPQVQAIGTR